MRNLNNTDNTKEETQFHLTMHCYLCSLLTEALHLNEYEATQWLAKEELDSVKWLPADLEVVEKIMNEIKTL